MMKGHCHLVITQQSDGLSLETKKKPNKKRLCFSFLRWFTVQSVTGNIVPWLKESNGAASRHMSVATSQQPCQGLEIASWCREHYGQASFHLHAAWFNSIPPSAPTVETLKPQHSQPPEGKPRAGGMCELILRESFLSNINVGTYFHVA